MSLAPDVMKQVAHVMKQNHQNTPRGNKSLSNTTLGQYAERIAMHDTIRRAGTLESLEQLSLSKHANAHEDMVADGDEDIDIVQDERSLISIRDRARSNRYLESSSNERWWGQESSGTDGVSKCSKKVPCTAGCCNKKGKCYCDNCQGEDVCGEAPKDEQFKCAWQKDSCVELSMQATFEKAKKQAADNPQPVDNNVKAGSVGMVVLPLAWLVGLSVLLCSQGP